MAFVEREHPLEDLQRAFDKAVSGEGNTVFVQGEAGIGKSSLVKQFLEHVRHRSVQLIGHCDDLFSSRPLGPLHDIALQCEAGPTMFTNNNTRTAIFRGFVEYLLSETRTMILVFEDIHWADEATLDFIKYLARRISRFHCVFILTWRDTEVHNDHPIYNVLGDLPVASLTRLQLQPLSARAVHRLAAERNRDGDHIFRISGGNPFFVHELLNGAEAELPQSIRDTVLVSYNREPLTTREAWQLLSLMPEGIELDRIQHFPQKFGEALSRSLEKGILDVKGERLVFRHELFRLSVASTLTPIGSSGICRQIMNVLLPAFKAKNEWARIVHYARQAGDQELIFTYAPKAAVDAALAGAHAESVKLYQAALDAASQGQEDALLPLYEGYAYECYLTARFEEAAVYTNRALHIYEACEQTELLGKSLRFLSRLWWFRGNHAEAEKYALLAIDVLKDEPISSVKAMAYSNLSQLYMLQKKRELCLHWGEQAITMARLLGDREVLSHALNNVGYVQLKDESSLEKGKPLLEESLQLALTNDYHEHAARAYTNLISRLIEIRQYDLAMKYLEEGLHYCEERDLDSWITYKLVWKARLLLETGSWQEALELARRSLRKEQSPVVKIGAIVIEATVNMRQGEQPVVELLLEAKTLAFSTEEHQRIMPVMMALLELEWITGDKFISEQEIDYVTAVTKEVGEMQQADEFWFWLLQAGRSRTPHTACYKPYQLLENGRVTEAADFWLQKGCSYNAALALFHGSGGEKRKALRMVQAMNATATAERMEQEMRAAGMKSVVQKRRNSTLSNPAQLTNRELEILQLLRAAASNREISETLFISPKTVDHHVSSILSKLNAPSRSKAVARAVEIGVLK